MYHCQGCTERREWIKKWIKVGADRAKTLMGVKEVKQIAEVQDNDTESTSTSEETNSTSNTDGSIDTNVDDADSSNGGTDSSDIPISRRNRKTVRESIATDEPID